MTFQIPWPHLLFSLHLSTSLTYFFIWYFLSKSSRFSFRAFSLGVPSAWNPPPSDFVNALFPVLIQVSAQMSSSSKRQSLTMSPKIPKILHRVMQMHTPIVLYSFIFLHRTYHCLPTWYMQISSWPLWWSISSQCRAHQGRNFVVFIIASPAPRKVAII